MVLKDHIETMQRMFVDTSQTDKLVKYNDPFLNWDWLWCNYFYQINN